MKHLSKERGAGCPKRWRMEHVTHWQEPTRPPACPCLWSAKLIDNHFRAIMGADADLSLVLSHLMTLWAD